jgi:hypothetical protein
VVTHAGLCHLIFATPREINETKFFRRTIFNLKDGSVGRPDPKEELGVGHSAGGSLLLAASFAVAVSSIIEELHFSVPTLKGMLECQPMSSSEHSSVLSKTHPPPVHR